MNDSGGRRQDLLLHCQHDDSESNDSIPNPDIVAPGRVVDVRFSLKDEDGTIVQTDQETFSVLVGSRQLLPRIETALLGLRIGDRMRVQLKPHEAFGERDDTKIVDFDRDEFPSDVHEGDHYEAVQDDGSLRVLRIIEVRADWVTVDLNHPLAGQTIEFEFRVVNVRPASGAEIDVGTDSSKTPFSAKPDAWIPVERLLRGRAER